LCSGGEVLTPKRPDRLTPPIGEQFTDGALAGLKIVADPQASQLAPAWDLADPVDAFDVVAGSCLVVPAALRPTLSSGGQLFW
jgi:hypothetical protein